MAAERLRLPGDAWYGLQALFHDDTVASDDLELLGSLQLVDAEGVPTTRARELCASYLDAVAVARIHQARPQGSQEASLWFSPDRSSLLEVSDEREVLLRPLPPGASLLALASFLGLGPRPPLSGEAVAVDTSLVDELFSPEDPRSAAERLGQELREPWPDVRDALVQQNWRAWMLDAHVLTEPPTLRGGTTIMDTAAGVFGVDVTTDGAVLVPLSPTAVWERLASLLGPAA